ncbi:hypothetical protein AOG1_06240 [Geobacter sp. AOG1]|nr:hypothetical protein AOG1_06240 [Geobacter sp. AOG1]
MCGEKPSTKMFTASDVQRHLDRIMELETENAHLKAENAALIAEVATLQKEINKAKSEPEYTEAFKEATDKD